MYFWTLEGHWDICQRLPKFRDRSVLWQLPCSKVPSKIRGLKWQSCICSTLCKQAGLSWAACLCSTGYQLGKLMCWQEAGGVTGSRASEMDWLLSMVPYLQWLKQMGAGLLSLFFQVVFYLLGCLSSHGLYSRRRLAQASLRDVSWQPENKNARSEAS